MNYEPSLGDYVCKADCELCGDEFSYLEDVIAPRRCDDCLDEVSFVDGTPCLKPSSNRPQSSRPRSGRSST